MKNDGQQIKTQMTGPIMFTAIAGWTMATVPAYWIYLCYRFLYYGAVGDDPGRQVLIDLGLANNWLIYPDSWIGIHKILMFALDMLGPAAPILPVAWMIYVIAQAAEDSKSENEVK